MVGGVNSITVVLHISAWKLCMGTGGDEVGNPSQASLLTENVTQALTRIFPELGYRNCMGVVVEKNGARLNLSPDHSEMMCVIACFRGDFKYQYHVDDESSYRCFLEH
ncbi:hypothetical protein BKA56DRAFT_33671 [Ilyonectria sp. MPI-CAGE-AT-0026]|nr:hypothetical protein BKA56DRAFT_33671 [Ilyonectria sp. MPI-CAGE-AT-0026]